MESGLVIDVDGNVIHRHAPSGRTSASLPDSRQLWDVIWENRDRLLGIAHSHPGRGVPSPSGTDLTTFDAVERALGRRLSWWIASEDETILCSRVDADYAVAAVRSEPYWIEELRALGRP